MTTEKIAKICHEANRAYCVEIGDNSQKPWDEAQDWQRDSAKAQVARLVLNPDCSPRMTHESWLKEKIDGGWVYGLVKDASKKEHPCCIPYDNLPEVEKAKDALFLSIVVSLTPLLYT